MRSSPPDLCFLRLVVASLWELGWREPVEEA